MWLLVLYNPLPEYEYLIPALKITHTLECISSCLISQNERNWLKSSLHKNTSLFHDTRPKVLHARSGCNLLFASEYSSTRRTFTSNMESDSSGTVTVKLQKIQLLREAELKHDLL